MICSKENCEREVCLHGLCIAHLKQQMVEQAPTVYEIALETRPTSKPRNTRKKAAAEEE